MTWGFSQILESFLRGGRFGLLKESQHGIERETLRITDDAQLAKTPHPKLLGSPLTNPFITTDFAEPQLELVTPVFNKEEKAIESLKNIHLFVSRNLPADELLWAFSMPCRLPSQKKIPLAQYGKSREGQKRTAYRLGLSYRYGRKMQTVCGTHYNFSFSEKFWQHLHGKFAAKEDLKQFISKSYLKLIRNFLRMSWLNTYLFGAAPAIDKSYLDKKYKFLRKLDRKTLFGPYATSLRLSHLGYYSVVQSQLSISFNDLESYLYDLKYAVGVPSPSYKGFTGLNDHILQIENEHYSRIRPKPHLGKGERPLDALQRDGIKYVEVRAVDISPYDPTGLKKDQLCFLHTFLLYCLFKASPVISKREEREITRNQDEVAIFGRRPDLMLSKSGKAVAMKKWGASILNEMQEVAKLMDRNFKSARYVKSLEMQRMKLDDVSITPSQRILTDLKKAQKSHAEFGLGLCKEHAKYFKSEKLNKNEEEKFRQAVINSLKEQNNIEIKDEVLLEGHEDLEMSTQILIREAKRRKINVEILDRANNFLLLSKGRRREYVKQATETSKDSLISFMIMGNKKITKQILSENGITTPWGETFLNEAAAIKGYPRFFNAKVAVKPTTTNYGIGISFVNPGDRKAYVKAVKEAFICDSSIQVEEFIEGREYRFLVINFNTISVLRRVPANVTGDGTHTVSELIDVKNNDAGFYKFFNTYTIKKGSVEKRHLKEQGLTMQSIPRKGRTIFLRTNSNVSTGGDPIDCTDSINLRYKKIAEKASKLVDARICGVDMIIGKNKYAIIELNFNPALQMHEYPVEGRSRPAAKAVLKLLGF